MTDVFWNENVACVGWDKRESPSLHNMIKHIKVGDIIYIKTYQPDRGLTIKAIGLVVEDNVLRIDNVGDACLRMKWVWKGKELMGKIEDRYNVRRNTLYEEFNSEVQERVIDLMTSNIHTP